ncbi:MAG: bifunctional hydroxymethylpyrimidine kinase/phosphomethylpyrimidine kinase [Clostridium sp.]|nr:bifunctional hydroxymethylpyrimidine kinase/phosphomethylpyrimidine kinase [Clostridium sp.]
MESNVQNPGAIPRLAMINDLTGFGRCSLTVALPVVSAMQVQGCPVPTSILSNHLGFPACFFHDYTSHIGAYLDGISRLGIAFDGIACGFLANVRQIDIVEEFLQNIQKTDIPKTGSLTANTDGIPAERTDSPKTGSLTTAAGSKTLFILDPVLGDHGRTYSTVTPAHCERLRGLAAYADLLTPNITEACLLTQTPYREGYWPDSELARLCETLAQGHPLSPDDALRKDGKKIVITGLFHQGRFRNYIWENQIGSCYEVSATGASRPGTGDLFAAVLAASALRRIPFPASVQKAADFVALCIQGTQEAGVPINEGVLFEKYLHRLMG